MTFVNESLLELRREAVREQLLAQLAELDARLPLSVPVIVGGERRYDDELRSVDPGDPARVVARCAVATAADVEQAVHAARRAQRAWAAEPVVERAAVLTRAAGILRSRRLELAALEVRECAKPWQEADADVCEAIDFLEYYAREAEALERRPQPVQLPGERNQLRYAARGVAAVIAPWNFPLAIATGMTAAALATGNAVVLKPAEQSPACALALVEALLAAGLPAGALALLPGAGEVGAALAAHPHVETIVFTGSGAVGAEIMRTAAEIVPGQRHIKRVIAELGGKNCVIVDSDADLDDAVPALVYSAFGFAGQKCSAASRVLVHETVADALSERLAGAISVLRVGQAGDFATDVPPVIEPGAAERVARYRSLAARDGQVIAEQPAVPREGCFAVPTLAGGLPPDSAVLHEEIFGPVLALERVPDVMAACERVEELPFALTGGLFTRNPATVRLVSERSPVGNLYVNRGTTGAMVARQPFGGNRLSGTGTKAGGADYLMHFVEPRVVTENTMRHGLVV
jgi:RHH-type transcriptional regulator, proline utilization regulon repressor / proline dehydrogenase / delta 1-pyrroline-5-carboxylate dehydrogenase